MLKRIGYIVSLLLCAGFLSAQTLSGYIYDRESNEPVWNASVYLDGTSYNTITDVTGRFDLSVGREMNTRLVISHVKYDKVVCETPFLHLADTIYLEEKVTIIDEVIVAKGKGSVKYSQEKKMKAFLQQFLGTTKAGKSCVLLNEEDVQLIYDSNEKLLIARANVPLIIMNKLLGYKIHYDLSEFEARYKNNNLNSKASMFYCSGTSSFMDISNGDPVITHNREQIYHGSVSNFVQNLYYRTLDESDYKLSVNDKELLQNDCFEIVDTLGSTLVRVKADIINTDDQNSGQITDNQGSGTHFVDAEQYNFLRVLYKRQTSEIIFFTDSFWIDSSHILYPMNKIFYSGNMGDQRVGDMLPQDYGMSVMVNEGVKNDRFYTERIQQNFLKQIELFPQEKLHLHIDREYYVPGERIWFKAYVANAASNQPLVGSRYVYVDLINSSDSLIHRVKVREENGMFNGHIFLSDMFPEGMYTVQGYTKYMENQEDDYLFRKRIRIGNVLRQPENKDEGRLESKKSPLSIQNDFDVSFYPEGGNLLEGTLCKVAFKVLRADGTSEDISGEIVDEEGTKVTGLKTIHQGMGVFGFIPKKGKKYYADCVNEDGLSKRFILPEAKRKAYSLVIPSRRNGKLVVGVLGSEDIDEFESFYILLHCRGEVVYCSEWNNPEDYLVFPESSLPSGVVQILLLDKSLNPLSERLIFSKNEDQALLEFTTDKSNYKIRDFVSATLKVTDQNGELLSGNISIAVTDDKDVSPDRSVSILSTLLLSSELKGHIESPHFYFEDDNEKTTLALDYLMMIHGWRRYNTSEVIKGNMQYPVNSVEQSMDISGEVKGHFRSTPVAGGKVSLLVLNTGEFMESDADQQGKFSFKGIEFKDSTKFLLQSVNSKGGKFTELVVDEIEYPTIKSLPYSPKSDKQQKLVLEETVAMESFKQKAVERYKYDEEMRIVHLESIDVVAAKRKKEDKPWSVFSMGATSSMDLKRIEELKPTTLADVFYTMRGVKVSQGFFPGDISVSVLGSGGSAAIYIDDVYMPEDSLVSPLSLVSVHDIERIDVFSGADATLFGTRGSNGVVNITTKKGGNTNSSRFEIDNKKVYSPLGYQTPVEFYSPKYDTEERKFDIKPDLRTTIFWKPDILVNEKGEAAFDFYTSDFSTTYSVVIEGLTTDGRIIRGIEKITVK